MKNLVNTLVDVRNTTIDVSKVDHNHYAQLEHDFNVLIRHAGEKVSFETDFIRDLFSLSVMLSFENGYNTCLSAVQKYVETAKKEEISNEGNA